MRYELEYVQPRPAFYDTRVVINEKKVHIIEADNDEEAEYIAKLLLAGRTKISLRVLRLAPTTRSRFLSMDPLKDPL